MRLGDGEIRGLLRSFVSRRVAPGDVDDVVQTVLCAALAATTVPADDDELRRWLLGIAKHKIADHHRASRRLFPADTPEIGVEPPPYEARAMVRWAEKAARNEYRATETLSWMAREGEGEALAAIATDAALPPARIRQRVSRLRRELRRRWTREIALAAGAGLVLLLGWLWWSQTEEPHPIRGRWRSSPAPAALHAEQLRSRALQDCADERWSACLDGLDRAGQLDSAGDAKPAIRAARQRAIDGLAAPAPEPTSSPTSAPTTAATTSPGPTPTSTLPPTVPKRTPPSSPKFGPKPATGLK